MFVKGGWYSWQKDPRATHWFFLFQIKKGTSKLTKMAILRKKGTLGNQWQSLINSLLLGCFGVFCHRNMTAGSREVEDVGSSSRKSNFDQRHKKNVLGSWNYWVTVL